MKCHHSCTSDKRRKDDYYDDDDDGHLSRRASEHSWVREGREGLVVRLDTWFENVMTMMIVAKRMRFSWRG